MKRLTLLLPLLAAALCRADEAAFYSLLNAAAQYEGVGYRETPSGWQLKVKPKSQGQAVRWRRGAFQFQYWRNNPYYSLEDGNTSDGILRQTGQTRLALNAALADARFPLVGSSVEAVVGLLAVHLSLDRKNVDFQGVFHGPGTRETLTGLGPALGFHAAGRKQLSGDWSLWSGGEVLAAQLLHTRNRQKTAGGSIRREGFSYLFRAEAGVQRGAWRLGVGLIRQMHEILVPGGKSLPNGGAASLPINKVDFQSPFISLTWEGL